jgi:Organic solute transporter Ostalpha
VQAFFVATIFVLLSLPVSLYEIAMHLENFNRPKLQTRIIRILFMVPIYALDRCPSVFAWCTTFGSRNEWRSNATC